MEILSNVIQLVLEYLIPIFITTLFSYLAFKLKPVLEDEVAKNIVEVLVKSAEQLYKAGNGEQKLNYVTEEAQKWLKKYNISIDLTALRALIESEVLKVNFEEKIIK